MKKVLVLSSVGATVIVLSFLVWYTEILTPRELTQNETHNATTTSDEEKTTPSSARENHQEYSNIQFQGQIESIDLSSGIMQVQAGKIWTSEDLPGDELGKIDVEISTCDKLYEKRDYTFIAEYYPETSRYVCNRVGIIIYD